MKTKIVAHCLVKNEARWIWYSIMSVIKHVDEIMVWDTGSTDMTSRIINSINSEKIKFLQCKDVTPQIHTQFRQKMIDETDTRATWIMILDGDEIWPEESIRKATIFARSHSDTESIVTRTNNLVGDIYHRLPLSAGMYKLTGKTGHLNLRFINFKNISGLHVNRPHGQQGFYDSKNKLIQDRDQEKITFLDLPYHHATHLRRSNTKTEDLKVPKRKNKFKYEIGEKIPASEIPDVFFQPHPKIVPDVTLPANTSFWLKSLIVTLPRRLKRKLFPPTNGY